MEFIYWAILMLHILKRPDKSSSTVRDLDGDWCEILGLQDKKNTKATLFSLQMFDTNPPLRYNEQKLTQGKEDELNILFTVLK